MKKWLALAICSFLMVNVQAKEAFCGYKDYFRLSDESHPGIFLKMGASESELFMQFIGPRSFIIKDAGQCRSGYAHVTVAYDENNWCVLDIKDGPFMNHPTVNASCNGIHYLGTDYDGFSTHSYTINLD